MDFAKKVYKVRKELGLTQDEFANELGVSFAAVNRWEQGSLPSSKSIKLFEDYCEKNNVLLINDGVSLGLVVVTASMIENWISNNLPDAISYLPSLLNDLAIESGCKPSDVRFQCGNQVYKSGFDGEINNSFGIEFIPDGDSVWEIGCEKNSKAKLNADYSKRTKETDLEFRKNHSLVLVSSKVRPATMENKNWCMSKNDGWKSVTIIDPIDLENWLSHCINTSSKFFAKINNIDNFYINSIGLAWNDFSKCTTPNMVTSLFTKDRQREVDIFIKKIESKQSFVVSAKCLEEAYGFILSSIIEKNICENEYIVVDEKWLDFLNRRLSNKCFIVQNCIRSFISSNGNRCISTSSDIKNGDIMLDYRSISTLNNILKEDMGIDEIELNRKIKADNVSISNIMFLFKSDMYSKRFEWDSDKITSILPVLLIDRVDFNSEQDRTLLSMISKSSVEEIKTALMRLETMNDNPLYDYKDNFKIHNKETIWIFFYKELNDYFEITLEIFENFFVSDSKKFSEYTIKALFDSLILYSIYNGKQEEIDTVVERIMNEAKTELIIEYSSLFAELSPVEYLRYLNKCINSNEIDSVFSDSGQQVYFGGHEYTKVLFSLERLFFLKEYRKIALKYMFAIYNRDYKYSINNSPQNTIVNNLLVFNNKSPFTFDEKKKFILEIIDDDTKNCVDLIMDILTKNSFWYVDVAPSRRPYDINTETITYKEIYDFYLFVIQKLLEKDDSPSVLIKLLKNYYCFTQEILLYIHNYIRCNEKYHGNLDLYYYLFEEKYHLYKYPKDNTDFVKKICLETLEVITPKSLLDKYSVLFINKKYDGCYDISTIDDDYIEEERKSENLKIKKLNELKDKYSYKTIIKKYVEIMPNDFDILQSFITVFNDDNIMLFLFVECLKNKKNILCSYLLNLNKPLINDYMNGLNDKKFEDNINILYYLDSSMIGLINFRNENNVKKIFENRWLGHNYSNYEYEMIKKYNPNCYLHIINYDKNYKDWNVEEVIEVLLNINEDKLKRIESYIIKETIDKLENVCFNETLIKVEIKYCDLYGYNKLPEKLTKYFYLNPKVLIDILLKNNNEYSKFKYKLMFSLSMPKDFYLDIISYQNFKNTFVSLNNSQNDDFLIDVFGEIYGRTVDIRFNSEASFFARKEIETIHNDAFNTGYYVGLSNTFGVRTVDDGTTKEMEVLKQDELLKELIEYPECSKIIKMFRHTSRYEADNDRKWHLEKSGLL